MRQWLLGLALIFVIVLSGCESGFLSDTEIDTLIGKIERYTVYNEVTNILHDEKLDDVEVYNYYVKENFFNYNTKSTENVELEYTTHYNAFASLEYIIDYLQTIEEFNYGNYYELEEYNAMIKLTNVDKVITVDYYQYFEELDIVSRQYYVLKEKDSKLYMERFSTTVDLKTDDVLLHQKLSVLKGVNIEQIEYIPKTMTISYIYNSFENQEYFKYKGFFDDFGDYSRETVEVYLEEHNSFVSYDIKDDELEDYRIKVFDEGHRVLKYDVNIFKKNETESEFTWNLLSVDGWAQITNNGGEYQVFGNTGRIMEDYDVSIQRDGYGKIEAYKMITGDVTESDVNLSEYNEESHITLSQLEATRKAFVDVYVELGAQHGFIISNEVNKELIENYFILYLENGKLDDFTNTYK